MDTKPMQFIDADRFPVVFTTEELSAQTGLRLEHRKYEKGEVIFGAQECHPFTYHVASGIVRLYLSSAEGAVKTLFYHAAGTQFGFQGFKRDRMTSSTAEAITDCELFAIDYADLIEFCDEHTEYYMAYIEYLFSIMNSQTGEIASLSFQTGVQRVAHLLCALASDGEMVVSYPIDELAAIIGTHRNTVSNALSLLRKLGLVEKSPRPLRVRDLAGLRAFAEGAELS